MSIVKQNKEQDAEKHCERTTSFQEYLVKHPSVIFYNDESDELVNFEASPQDKYDSKNNKIPQGTFERHSEDAIIALAHHDLVTPAYLLEIESKPSLKEITEDVLFGISKEEEGDDRNSLESSIVEKTTNSVKEYSLEIVVKELDKEYTARQRAHLKYLKTKLDDSINSVIDQLSLKISSVTEINCDPNKRYTKEIVQVEDDDYKFILDSIADINKENIPKILHLFKINPVDKNEVTNLKDTCIFLSGIKSNKVNEILTNGYSRNKYKKGHKKFDTELATTSFDEQVESGLSYHAVDNVVKKVSFVFVASSEDEYWELETKQVVRDSRGSCVEVGLFRDVFTHSAWSCLTPLYLIVFELE